MNIERLIELDEQFRLNDCHGDSNKPMFEFKEGSVPIIFTAPHSVITMKYNKKSSEHVEKQNETLTGGLTMYSNEMFGVHAMVRNNYPYNVYVDPRGDYLSLLEYIKKFDIKYLVDIHGAKRKSTFDIAPGISHGVYIHNDNRYKNAILDSFNTAGIPNINFDTKFQASGEKTISNFVFENAHIKTTQLEINRNYRDKELLNNLKQILIGFKNYTDTLQSLIEEDYSKTMKF